MGECAKIPKLQDGQTYHAFIIHNSETERDVSLQLYEDLTDKGYKCCHADLDFQPGTRVVANIMNTINESRRVIAIVSPQFLESSWCNLEMVTTINLSYDRDRQLLIPILYNINPDTDKLPADIKSMTYLEYKDTHFWKKLTDALVSEYNPRVSEQNTMRCNLANGATPQIRPGFSLAKMTQLTR